MDAAFLNLRLSALKLRIAAYEDAILALGTANGVQSYTLDTGQTRQTVTRYDIDKLQAALDGMLNQCAIYQARLTGCNVVQGGACW